MIERKLHDVIKIIPFRNTMAEAILISSVESSAQRTWNCITLILSRWYRRLKRRRRMKSIKSNWWRLARGERSSLQLLLLPSLICRSRLKEFSIGVFVGFRCPLVWMIPHIAPSKLGFTNWVHSDTSSPSNAYNFIQEYDFLCLGVFLHDFIVFGKTHKPLRYEL